MGKIPAPVQPREVAPLELFFDLVFVFAVSQLSQHLFQHLSWRGALETLVLGGAVFTVWVHTSFEATFFDITRRQTQLSVLAAMGIGLFMNAAIASAFTTAGPLFAVPLVVIQLARGILTNTAAPTQMLQRHYRHMLIWLVASVPFWLVGAFASDASRLWWWLAAVSIDVAGTLLAHPVPGASLHSTGVPFDGAHMSERLRLFLIIALGEAILVTGTAIAEHPTSATSLVAGDAAFVVVAALWALFFGGSERIVERHLAATCDPLRAARLGANGQYVVLAGLIAVAVGCELVVAHPDGQGSATLGLLLFGGAFLYATTQTWYLHATSGYRSAGRWVGCALLAAGFVPALVAPPLVSLTILAAILTGLAAYAVRDRSPGEEAGPDVRATA